MGEVASGIVEVVVCVGGAVAEEVKGAVGVPSYFFGLNNLVFCTPFCNFEFLLFLFLFFLFIFFMFFIFYFSIYLF